MDPFKHAVNTERCSSSKSGWTRYLVSPTQDGFECSQDKYNSNYSIEDDNFEGNSDDSMVSDASSAPSHHRYKLKNGHGSHVNADLKHDKRGSSSKHSSRKDTKNEVKKSAESSGKSKRRLSGQAKYHY